MQARRHPHRAGPLLAALIVLLLALTACGSPGEVEVVDDVDASPSPTAAPEPTATPEPIATPEPTATPAPDAAPTTPPPAPEEHEATTVVAVYFWHEDRGDPCGEAFPVRREVAAEDPIGEALVALLAGPTEAEQDAGYGSWFSAETAGMLRGYRAEGGVLYVDFDDFSSVIPNASTACGSAALLAQLGATVGQFEGVGEPRYSFAGDVAAFYEWLQLDPPGT